MTIRAEVTDGSAVRAQSNKHAGKDSGDGRPENSEISLVIRRTRDGREILRSRIDQTDIVDACSELWLDEYLRKGQPDMPMDSLVFFMKPVIQDGHGSRCDGITLEMAGDRGQVLRRELPLAALQDVSLRLAQRLIGDGTLTQQDTYCYELIAGPVPPVLAALPPAAVFKTTTKNPPLRYLTRPIAPLMRQARVIGTVDDRMMSVFYTEAALEKAARFARKGAQQQPPIESGCVLVGPTCSCPDSGEFYVVVCDALELVDAEGTRFSLAYTGKTWTRIQAVVRAMQLQSETAAFRMLGQAHGHNWLPLNGAPPCENCSRFTVCGRTTVFVSLDDRTWTRCVFSRQPWQLCHIYGLNARGEEVTGLFGLRDNQLQERGYCVIPDFEISKELTWRPRKN